MTQQGAGDGKALFLAAGDFHATFADYGVKPAVGAGQQAVDSSLVKHFHALFVAGFRIHKQQILTD